MSLQDFQSQGFYSLTPTIERAEEHHRRKAIFKSKENTMMSFLFYLKKYDDAGGVPRKSSSLSRIGLVYW